MFHLVVSVLYLHVFMFFFLYSILQQVVAAWHLPKGLSIKFLVISRDG